MNIIASGIAILSGSIAGSIFASAASSKLKNTAGLFDAISMLKNYMCSYSSGLFQSLCESHIDEKCSFFSEIKKISASKQPYNSLIEAIENSNYIEAIKNSLIKLFDAIEHFDECELTKAFDATLDVIQAQLNDLTIKKNKNAPLYRKLGFLSGIAIAILII